MSKPTAAGMILTQFFNKIESVIDDYNERLNGVNKESLTLGEMEELEKRSEVIQQKFDTMGD